MHTYDCNVACSTDGWMHVECMSLCTFVCLYVHPYTSVCMYVCMYVCTNDVCMYVIYMYVRTNVMYA